MMTVVPAKVARVERVVVVTPPQRDGRVLFAVPWHGYVIVGTTDHDYTGDIVNPGCTPEEEADVLAAVNRFFHLGLGPDAVLSRWAGVRPLVTNGEPGSDKVSTKDISRKPQIQLDGDGLLTVTGGKLTTFWRMAEDALKLLPPPPLLVPPPQAIATIARDAMAATRPSRAVRMLVLLKMSRVLD